MQFESIFNSSLSPRQSDVDSLKEAIAHEKVVPLTSYNVRTFDFSEEKDRKSFEETMMCIYQKVQAGTCVIWAKDRQILHKKDGSTTWCMYLEWSEYDPMKNKEKDS